MDSPSHPIKTEDASVADPALQLWLQKLREMYRPEEEIVCLDM